MILTAKIKLKTIYFAVKCRNYIWCFKSWVKIRI